MMASKIKVYEEKRFTLENEVFHMTIDEREIAF